MVLSTMAPLRFFCIRVFIATVTFAAILSQVYGQGDNTSLSAWYQFVDFAFLFVAEGVYLSLNGTSLANNSYVDVDDIGIDVDALLCHTNKIYCCGSKSVNRSEDRAGEWYSPCNEKKKVGTLNNRKNVFYRNRGPSVVRLNRHGNPSQGGCFQCEVENASNVIQMVFINIGMFFNILSILVHLNPYHAHVVDVGAILAFPSVPMTVHAGDYTNLMCSTVISSDPQPQTVIVFEWFYGPDSNLSLPSGVTVSNNKTNNNNYTSILQFSPLLPSHAGMYTCQFGGNQRLQRNVEVSVSNCELLIMVFSLS